MPSGISSLSSARQWYISNDGKTGTGPYSQQEISELYQKQQFYAESVVWMDGVSPESLKSSPHFAFLFQAPQNPSTYSSANTTGLQVGQDSNITGQNPFAQDNLATANPSSGLSPDVIHILSRPIAWILAINLFLSLLVVVGLVFDILAIRSLIEEKIHSGAVAVVTVGLFIALAFSIWIVVEHWRYFNSIQAFSKAPTEIRLIAVGRRTHVLWRTWSFFMLYLLVASFAFIIVTALVAP